MKNNTIRIGVIFLAVLFIGFSATAQEKKEEKSKMAVKVLKEGKTVLDTTYIMDKDFDQDKIEKMIEELDGDSKTINIFKSEANDVQKDEKLKWVTKDGNEMIFIDELDIDEAEEGNVVKYIVKKEDSKAEELESNVVIIKKIGEECEDGEIETEIEVIVGEGEEGIHKYQTKEGNVMFFGGDKPHKAHKGNVFVHSGEGHGEDFTWTTDENDGNVKVEVKGDVSDGDFQFFPRERASQISLDQNDDGTYRLEFESDDLKPIKVEIFDGEGNKLFKKKVKNFYGRFLKNVELSDNETGLYTVRVLQGDKEIIGEIEYK